LVKGHYRRAAHKVDVKYNGTAADAKGPMEQALENLGGVHPLVFGHYGEVCKSTDQLLRSAAEVGARRLQGALYVKTPEQAAAVLLWQLRRKVSAAILRANLDCLQNHMQHLSKTAAASRRCRDAARRRFFRGGDPSSASYQYNRTHFLMWVYTRQSHRTRDAQSCGRA